MVKPVSDARRPTVATADGVDARQRWGERDEVRPEGVEARSRPLDLDDDGARRVAHRAGEVVPLGERPDERPEAHALDDTGHGVAAPLGDRPPRARASAARW